MIKGPVKKKPGSLKTLIVYNMLMFISFFLVYCTIFVHADSLIFKYIVIGSFFLSFILSIMCWWMEPGYLNKDPKFSFMELLEEFEPNCLCPECEVIKTPRSRHCNICNRCIDRFDHHCPWINNCVGVKYI